MRDDTEKDFQVPGLGPSLSSLSRRSFLGRASASTAVVAAAMGMTSLLTAQNPADTLDPGTANAISGPVDGRERRGRAFQLRIRAAREEHSLPVPEQTDNGDEALYPNRIGSFSKGLTHDSIGEVDPTAYDSLLTAVRSGDRNDFDNIPLGGNTKLVSPQAGLCFTLQGRENGQLTSPPAPTLASAERAGEMVEDYWMALARDIPFSQYGNEPVTTAAIADPNKMSDFRGPKVGDDQRHTFNEPFSGFTFTKFDGTTITV